LRILKFEASFSSFLLQEFGIHVLTLVEAISIISTIAWEFTYRPTIQFTYSISIPQYFDEFQTQDLASVLSQLGDHETDNFILSRIIELISDARNHVVSHPMCRTFSQRNCKHADETHALLLRYSSVHSSTGPFVLRLRFKALNQPSSLQSTMLIRRIAATLIDHAASHALDPLAAVPMNHYRQVEDKIRTKIGTKLLSSAISKTSVFDSAFETLAFVDEPRNTNTEFSILSELGATIDQSTAMLQEQERRHQDNLQLLQSQLEHSNSLHFSRHESPGGKISVATSPISSGEQASSLAISLDLFLQRGTFSQLKIEQLMEENDQLRAAALAAKKECDEYRNAVEAAQFRADSMQRVAASAWGFAINPASPLHPSVPSDLGSWRSSSSAGSNGSASATNK
jgi:hypothetical protein